MSDLRVNSIAGADGTSPATLVKQSAAKAWANLNGTGTIALRDSFNISSVVDNGVGDYTFNYTNPMSGGNNAASFSGAAYPLLNAISTGNVNPRFYYPPGSPGTLADTSIATVSIHGDLA